MPGLPVIEDVYRVTWNFASFNGVTPRIVQHFTSPSSDADVFGAALVAVAPDALFQPMPTAFNPRTIDVLPLDGTTPTATFNLDPTTDFCGGDPEFSPASAYVFSIRTAQRGPQGRGRSYIGPVSESAMQDGTVHGTSGGDLQTAWGDFGAALAALDPFIRQGVASYTHSEFYPATGFTIRPILGTQRRRQDQLH